MCVGFYGTIQGTTDEGENWTSRSPGTRLTFNDAWFTDEANGVAAGDSGTILRTTNGGTTWTRQSRV